MVLSPYWMPKNTGIIPGEKKKNKPCKNDILDFFLERRKPLSLFCRLVCINLWVVANGLVGLVRDLKGPILEN